MKSKTLDFISCLEVEFMFQLKPYLTFLFIVNKFENKDFLTSLTDLTQIPKRISAKR